MEKLFSLALSASLPITKCKGKKKKKNKKRKQKCEGRCKQNYLLSEWFFFQVIHFTFNFIFVSHVFVWYFNCVWFSNEITIHFHYNSICNKYKESLWKLIFWETQKYFSIFPQVSIFSSLLGKMSSNMSKKSNVTWINDG